jgi:hypothetical protein
MHSPGTLTSRSHTRGGPRGSSPHMKLAMRPCIAQHSHADQQCIFALVTRICGRISYTFAVADKS